MKMLIDLDCTSEPMDRMKISVSRRGILRAAADAAEERRRSRNGLPSFRIEDLVKFSAQEMLEISPVVNGKANTTIMNLAAAPIIAGIFSIISALGIVVSEFVPDKSLIR